MSSLYSKSTKNEGTWIKLDAECLTQNIPGRWAWQELLRDFVWVLSVSVPAPPAGEPGLQVLDHPRAAALGDGWGGWAGRRVAAGLSDILGGREGRTYNHHGGRQTCWSIVISLFCSCCRTVLCSLYIAPKMEDKEQTTDRDSSFTGLRISGAPLHSSCTIQYFWKPTFTVYLDFSSPQCNFHIKGEKYLVQGMTEMKS